MKNKITISVDTERKPAILFEKGEGSVIPTTHEEAQPLILIDINCLSDALITLIDVADQCDYGVKESLLNEAIAKLEAFRDLKQ